MEITGVVPFLTSTLPVICALARCPKLFYATLFSFFFGSAQLKKNRYLRFYQVHFGSVKANSRLGPVEPLCGEIK